MTSTESRMLRRMQLLRAPGVYRKRKPSSCANMFVSMNDKSKNMMSGSRRLSITLLISVGTDVVQDMAFSEACAIGMDHRNRPFSARIVFWCLRIVAAGHDRYADDQKCQRTLHKSVHDCRPSIVIAGSDCHRNTRFHSKILTRVHPNLNKGLVLYEQFVRPEVRRHH